MSEQMLGQMRESRIKALLQNVIDEINKGTRKDCCVIADCLFEVNHPDLIEWLRENAISYDLELCVVSNVRLTNRVHATCPKGYELLGPNIYIRNPAK